MTLRHLEKVIIRRLASRNSATLSQLVGLTASDYWEAWTALKRLRQRGIVHPPIRHGVLGRWRDGPVRYKLSYRAKRNLDA